MRERKVRIWDQGHIADSEPRGWKTRKPGSRSCALEQGKGGGSGMGGMV